MEDVANSITMTEGVVSNGALLLARLVSKCNHKLTLRVSNERVIKVVLGVRGVPDLSLLAGCINLSNDLVEVRVSVHLPPERLTVGRIVASAIILFRSIVDEWDTSGCHREDDSAGETNSVAISMKETCVVVIVYEETESIDVAEFTLLLVEAVLDASHALTTLPYVLDGVVHGVIEETGQGLLVRSNIGRVTVEAFAHLENTSCLTVLFPEVFGDFRNGVDADAVKVVRLDGFVDPVFKILANVAVVLVEIR